VVGAGYCARLLEGSQRNATVNRAALVNAFCACCFFATSRVAYGSKCAPATVVATVTMLPRAATGRMGARRREESATQRSRQ
jgi:hypothetical protein